MIIIRKFHGKRNPVKSTLTSLNSRIEGKYNEYDIAFNDNDLESIPLEYYAADDKNALLHCYTSGTKAKDDLIARIKGNQPDHLKSVCQFCGLNSNDTTDHFLPKELYPEFCVNHKNLIPCCFKCNLFKGIYLLDPRTTTRGILNLYLDTMPMVQFLFLDVSFFDGVPRASFRLGNPNGIDAAMFQIIQFHFERLKLLERYLDRFGSIYRQILSAYSDNSYNGNPILVQRTLLHDARTLFTDFGRNYYIAIIKESLATNTEFINMFI